MTSGRLQVKADGKNLARLRLSLFADGLFLRTVLAQELFDLPASQHKCGEPRSDAIFVLGIHVRPMGDEEHYSWLVP